MAHEWTRQVERPEAGLLRRHFQQLAVLRAHHRVEDERILPGGGGFRDDCLNLVLVGHAAADLQRHVHMGKLRQHRARQELTCSSGTTRYDEDRRPCLHRR